MFGASQRKLISETNVHLSERSKELRSGRSVFVLVGSSPTDRINYFEFLFLPPGAILLFGAPSPWGTVVTPFCFEQGVLLLFDRGYSCGGYFRKLKFLTVAKRRLGGKTNSADQGLKT